MGQHHSGGGVGDGLRRSSTHAPHSWRLLHIAKAFISECVAGTVVPTLWAAAAARGRPCTLHVMCGQRNWPGPAAASNHKPQGLRRLRLR